MNDDMFHCIHHRELEAVLRERDLFRAASEAAELRIVELRALVSDQAATLRGFRDSIHRAEALVDRWNEASFVVHPNECAEDLAAALRGEP